MRPVRTWAAIAASIPLLLALPACSVIESVHGLFPPSQLPPQPPGPPQPVPPQSLTPPSPEAARAEIGRWLSEHGYKDFQIAAMLEHASTESGLRACAAGPGGFRYLFQWGGGRLQQLQQFAHTEGCPQIHVQMAFVDYELRNNPKFSCFWGATTESAAYAALRRGLGQGVC